MTAGPQQLSLTDLTELREPVEIEESAPAIPDPPPLVVDLIRSSRRRKSAQARLLGDRLEIRIPARCSAEEEREFVEHFVERFERTRRRELIDLPERADRLAQQFGLTPPTTIRWVGNQVHRWGSCTPSEGSVRLSDRMARFPQWVIDYVIVHELAHLDEPNHGDQFWSIVGRYPLTERARGYLAAKSEDPT